MVFNNEPRGICPKCGGQMSHQWDEQADYDREQYEDDRYDPEEDEDNEEADEE